MRSQQKHQLARIAGHHNSSASRPPTRKPNRGPPRSMRRHPLQDRLPHRGLNRNIVARPKRRKNPRADKGLKCPVLVAQPLFTLSPARSWLCGFLNRSASNTLSITKTAQAGTRGNRFKRCLRRRKPPPLKRRATAIAHSSLIAAGSTQSRW